MGIFNGGRKWEDIVNKMSTECFYLISNRVNLTESDSVLHKIPTFVE